jgi:hypothetical protein
MLTIRLVPDPSNMRSRHILFCQGNVIKLRKQLDQRSNTAFIEQEQHCVPTARQNHLLLMCYQQYAPLGL